jgi:hypothetical protein
VLNFGRNRRDDFIGPQGTLGDVTSSNRMRTLRARDVDPFVDRRAR